jgi:hypothetical protein
MNTLIFHPKHNAHGKRDVTGAFKPEAKKFCAMTGGRIITFDNHVRMALRRKTVLEAIRAADEPLDCIAFFCHGWRTGIQAGFRIKDVNELALAISKDCADGITIPLYACSTAKGGAGGDGAFADELRDALCRHAVFNCRIDAHDRKGHAARNPYVRRFEGGGSPTGGQGGQWVVKPNSRLWTKWKNALKKTDLRLRFPLMGVGAIHEELVG